MATPTFTNTGTITDVAVDGLLAAARFQKINLDLRISGAGVANVLPRSEVWVRPAGGGPARQCFWADKQPNANTGGSSVFGMATNLVEGTSYDVSVILSDGTNTREVVALVQTTRTLPSLPAALLAQAAANKTGAGGDNTTRYVREDGNDTNTGLDDTSGAAWRTIGKAFGSAPSGSITVVDAGAGGRFYPRVTTARTLGPLTIVSKLPAADDIARDSGGPQDPNPGAHAMLGEWKVQPTTGPAGATPGTMCATAPASETDTRFQGPNGSKWTLYTHSSLGYTCWVWDAPGTPVGSPQWVSWSTTKNGDREKIGVYAQQLSVVDTADRACELLNTIRDGAFGAVYLTISANSAENSKLYLKLPPHAGTDDPNNLYIWAGAGLAGDSKGLIESTNPDIRISGLDFKDSIHGIWLGVGADNWIIDHCAFSNHWVGVMPRGTQNAGVNSTYPNNLLVWRTRTVVKNLWSEDQVNRPSYAWAYIKALVGKQGQAGQIWKPFDGSTNYANRRLAGNCEQNACWGKGGATNFSFLENLVDGVFNGVSGDHTGFDQYAMYGLEVYGNLFKHLADDMFEPEKSVSNWDIHDNDGEDVITMVSTASHEHGPMLIYRNTVVRIGMHGMRAVAEDIPGQTFATAGCWKYKTSTVSAPLCAFANNTVHCLNPNLQWTPTGLQLRNSDGRFSAGGSLNNDIRFYERNNIYMGFNRDAIISGNPGGNASYPVTNLQWDEDHNYFHSSGDGVATGRAHGYAGTNYTDTAAYRAATTHGGTKPQQGTHTNDGLPGGGLANSTYRVAPYLSPNNQFAGDVTAGYTAMALTSGSVFRAAGIVVPGMMDRPGIDYAGAMPDLGGVQFGLVPEPPAPSGPPVRRLLLMGLG